jgi:hypothetical protein
MGVEYMHYLLPKDPTFIPSANVFTKIDKVLAKWNLKTSIPEIYDLTNGEKKILEQPLDTIQLGHGIAVKYPWIEGEVVSKILGESYYKMSDKERYIQDIIFIAGTDFRLQVDNESRYVEVIDYPIDNNVAVQPYENLTSFPFQEVYTCSANATPPKLKISPESYSEINREVFNGFWRMALVIDCGKDLPSFFKSKYYEIYKIKNHAFINDIEEALGTSISQVGEIY